FAWPDSYRGYRQKFVERRKRRGAHAQVGSAWPARGALGHLQGGALAGVRRRVVGERRHLGGRRRAVAARRNPQLPGSLRLDTWNDGSIIMSIDYSQAPHAW